MLSYLLQLTANGVIAGSVYALFAVGLTMIYGGFRFINFAHGELIAWGAYLPLLFMGPPLGLPLWAAAVPALALTVGLGLAQDRWVYEPLADRGRITLLIASIGLSYLLRNAIRLIWGSDLTTYGRGLARGVLLPGGILITPTQAAMVAASVLSLGCLYLLLTRTLLGKQLRAVADNRELAAVMGIDLRRTSMTVWALASLFSAIGGILLAMDTNLEPMMGLANLIKAFAAVLLGGAGNVWGALLGGLFIGISENLSVAVISPGYKDFVSFVFIILMLLFRPQGIFGISGGVR